MNHDIEMKKYSEERYRKFMENVVERPYWQWVGIEDSRLCPTCALLHGKVFMYDDPIWQKMIQRLHQGCRCRFRAYTAKNLIDKGLQVINSAELNIKEGV